MTKRPRKLKIPSTLDESQNSPPIDENTDALSQFRFLEQLQQEAAIASTSTAPENVENDAEAQIRALDELTQIGDGSNGGSTADRLSDDEGRDVSDDDDGIVVQQKRTKTLGDLSENERVQVYFSTILPSRYDKMNRLKVIERKEPPKRKHRAKSTIPTFVPEPYKFSLHDPSLPLDGYHDLERSPYISSELVDSSRWQRDMQAVLSLWFPIVPQSWTTHNMVIDITHRLGLHPSVLIGGALSTTHARFMHEVMAFFVVGRPTEENPSDTRLLNGRERTAHSHYIRQMAAFLRAKMAKVYEEISPESDIPQTSIDLRTKLFELGVDVRIATSSTDATATATTTTKTTPSTDTVFHPSQLVDRMAACNLKDALKYDVERRPIVEKLKIDNTTTYDPLKHDKRRRELAGVVDGVVETPTTTTTYTYIAPVSIMSTMPSTSAMLPTLNKANDRPISSSQCDNQPITVEPTPPTIDEEAADDLLMELDMALASPSHASTSDAVGELHDVNQSTINRSIIDPVTGEVTPVSDMQKEWWHENVGLRELHRTAVIYLRLTHEVQHDFEQLRSTLGASSSSNDHTNAHDRLLNACRTYAHMKEVDDVRHVIEQFMDASHSRLRAYNAALALHLCLSQPTNHRLDDSALRERRQYGLTQSFAFVEIDTDEKGPTVEELIEMHNEPSTSAEQPPRNVTAEELNAYVAMVDSDKRSHSKTPRDTLPPTDCWTRVRSTVIPVRYENYTRNNVDIYAVRQSRYVASQTAFMARSESANVKHVETEKTKDLKTTNVEEREVRRGRNKATCRAGLWNELSTFVSSGRSLDEFRGIVISPKMAEHVVECLTNDFIETVPYDIAFLPQSAIFRLIHKQVILSYTIGKTLRRELDAARTYVGDGEPVPGVLYDIDETYNDIAEHDQCFSRIPTSMTKRTFINTAQMVTRLTRDKVAMLHAALE